jgi:predicted nucleotidyltransferase
MRDETGQAAERVRVATAGFKYRFGVSRLSIFGSRSRGDERAGSDLDVLVEFDRPIGLLAFSQLESELSDLTGFRVDLVMRSALKPNLERQIISEAIPVA